MLSEYKIMHVENKAIIIVDTQSDIILGSVHGTRAGGVTFEGMGVTSTLSLISTARF